jgi:pyruvoyl-dependent arginine decarboxylase (PvlArgDC)
VKVTSVLAPGCRECDIEFVRQQSQAGRLLYAVDGKCITSIEGQLVSAGLALTLPDGPELPGFFAEIYEHPGILPEHLKRRVEKGSLQIFANHVGDQDFDPDSQWDDGKSRYRVGDKWVTLRSILASDTGKGEGNYTCVYVGVILL